MANYYFQPTGTRSTGASTIDDWSAANCYPPSAFVGLTQANGDTVVFDENLAGLGKLEYITNGQRIVTKGVTMSLRRGGENGSGAGIRLESNASTTTLALRPDSTALVTVNDIEFTNEFVTNQMVSIQHFTNEKNIILNRVSWLGIGVNTSKCLANDNGNGSFVMNQCKIRGLFTGLLITPGATDGADDFDYSSTVDGLDIDITASQLVLMEVFKLTKSDTANIGMSTIKNCNIKIVSTIGHVRCFDVKGFSAPITENNNIDITSPSATESVGIQIWGNSGTGANRTTVGAITRGNTVNFNCLQGHAIEIGDITHAGLDVMQDSETYGNETIGLGIGGAPHGLTLSGLSSGKAWGNKIRGTHQGLLLLYCDNDAVEGCGNLIYDVWDANLSYEGCSGGTLANNTVVVTPSPVTGQTSTGRGIWARVFNSQLNTGSKAYNNNIIVLGAVRRGMFVEVGSISDPQLDVLDAQNNNYYFEDPDGVLTPPSNAFVYRTSNYGDVANWNAGEGVDETAVKNFDGDVQEIIDAFGDVSLSKIVEDAANAGGGFKWWNGVNPETLGEPLSDIDTAQGIQSANSPFHPKNL